MGEIHSQLMKERYRKFCFLMVMWLMVCQRSHALKSSRHHSFEFLLRDSNIAASLSLPVYSLIIVFVTYFSLWNFVFCKKEANKQFHHFHFKWIIHLKWKWWDQFEPWQCIGYVFSKYVSTYMYQSEYLFMGMFLLQRSSNAAQSLCDLIRLSRDHMSQLQENADQDPLLDAVQRWVLLYCVVQQSVNRLSRYCCQIEYI